jgi:hypothetical protein
MPCESIGFQPADAAAFFQDFHAVFAARWGICGAVEGASRAGTADAGGLARAGRRRRMRLAMAGDSCRFSKPGRFRAAQGSP